MINHSLVKYCKDIIVLSDPPPNFVQWCVRCQWINPPLHLMVTMPWAPSPHRGPMTSTCTASISSRSSFRCLSSNILSIKIILPHTRPPHVFSLLISPLPCSRPWRSLTTGDPLHFCPWFRHLYRKFYPNDHLPRPIRSDAQRPHHRSDALTTSR
jgi:hypothetical protein